MKRFPQILLSLLLMNAAISQSGAGSNQTTQTSAKSFESRTMDIGLTAAYWLEGTVYVDGFGGTKDGSFLFRAFIDGYLMPKLAMGAYINFTPYSQDGIDITGIEFGVSIKPRFIINNKAAIKPGLNIGYRSLSSDDIETVNGMAVNFSIEYQMMMDENIFHLELGILTQPVGGNEFIDFSWGPIFYLGGGITL